MATYKPTTLRHSEVASTSSRKQSRQMYQLALERVNWFFRQYNEYRCEETSGKILHFTSRQLQNLINIIKFYKTGPECHHTAPQQFEEMFHNLQLLTDLKVTCNGEYIAELQHFHTLEHLHVIGPCLCAVKGLRSASTNLRSLIFEKGNITLQEVLSLCCMDESRPMSWPCLLSLKFSNCSISSLNDSVTLLPNLQELDLSFNKLTSIEDEFCSLDQLTSLNLGFNQLKKLPQFNGGIRWQLQYLHLLYNELTTLDGLQVLENLLELDVSHNMLLKHHTLQPLRHLGQLQKLNLQGNPLFYDTRHRKLSLCCVSPQALKPEFILDGKNLTKHDLEEAQYTPNAVSLQPHHFSVGGYPSINALEPEAYDVSLSSAFGASNRRVDGDQYFKFCDTKKRKSGSRAVISDGLLQPAGDYLATTPSSQASANDTLQGFGDEFSVISGMSGGSMHGSTSFASVSGLMEPDIEEVPDSKDDYLTVGIVIENAGDEKEFNDLETKRPTGSPESEKAYSVDDSEASDNSASKEKSNLLQDDSSSTNKRSVTLRLENVQIQNLLIPGKIAHPDDSSLGMQSESQSGCVDLTSFDENEEQGTEDIDKSLSYESAQSAGTNVSLSWMHAANSARAIRENVYSQSQGILSQDECNLSESLPNNFSAVSMQPCDDSSKLRRTASVSTVHGSQQLHTTTSRNFSLLLVPHPDLYKLVNVTSSTSAMQSKILTGCGTENAVQNNTEAGNMEGTPQKLMLTTEAGDTPVPSASRNRQIMVTSTPRRRPADAPNRIAPFSEIQKEQESLDIPSHPRALNFEKEKFEEVSKVIAKKSAEPIQSGSDVDLPLESSPQMKKFIEEELLEVDDELLAVFQTGLLRETGRSLASWNSINGSGRKSRLFRKRTPQKSTSSPSPSRADTEIDAILVLSTSHVHILEVTDRKVATSTESLKCLGSYSLDVVAAVDIGLTACTLLMAIASPHRKKRKFAMNDIDQVYVLQFRDRAKCDRFYRYCTDLVLNEEQTSRDESNTRLSVEPDDSHSAADLSSPFSDFLEKSFSEDVLMHLDLNTPNTSTLQEPGSDARLLKNELFSYCPCWMLDGETGEDLPVAVVISCGGSLCIVAEDIRHVMHEFATALVRSKQDKKLNSSTPKSYPSSDGLQIPPSGIQARSGAPYSFKSSNVCSKIKSIARYKEQPECLELIFKDSKDRDSDECWCLRFPDSSSLTVTQRLIQGYWETENEANLPVLWK